MSLCDDLKADITKIFKDAWSTREGRKVPDQSDIQLGNDAVKLEGTVLYADLAKSTHLVKKKKAFFAAEMYKSYLHCSAKIIRSQGGIITSYDGDRIMAVFIGDSKNTSAVKASLRINYIVRDVINPAILNQYPNTDFRMRQTVGIDTSSLFVARTGIRGSNDLVWVGRAANYAAKLTELTSDFPSWITHSVYKMLHKSVKYTDGKSMWEARSWTSMDNFPIYRSSWQQSC